MLGAAVVGIAIGVFICLSPNILGYSAMSSVSESLVAGALVLFNHLGDKIGESSGSTNMGQTVAAVLALCAPGLVALAFILAARVGLAVRRVIAALLVFGGIAGFFALDFKEAAILFVFAVACAVFLVLVGGWVLATGCWAMAAFIACGQIAALWNGTAAASLAPYTQILEKTSGISDPLVWQWVGTLMAAAPIVYGVLGAFSLLDSDRRVSYAD